MGIFSRFKDIVSSNINAMLDKAEDPEKMIRLMIQEMEETLVELKSSCAGIMADKKKSQREQSTLEEEVKKWSERAELAVSKGREDLAREALREKHRFLERIGSLKKEMESFDSLITQSRVDIDQIEEKINVAREKQKLLIQRHLRAGYKLKTQKEIRRANSLDAMQRFEEFEQKIDRMEAEANLVNVRKTPQPGSLEEKFSHLESDDTIEQELQNLKQKKQTNNNK